MQISDKIAAINTERVRVNHSCNVLEKKLIENSVERSRLK